MRRYIAVGGRRPVAADAAEPADAGGAAEERDRGEEVGVGAEAVGETGAVFAFAEVLQAALDGGVGVADERGGGALCGGGGGGAASASANASAAASEVMDGVSVAWDGERHGRASRHIRRHISGGGRGGG
ncbi:MAG: hypothetical protein H6705_01840 [Myxococcales bacterium]|nr:hypothetical protein [Myxococcales bacterium]